jgi:hypothetical protein
MECFKVRVPEDAEVRGCTASGEKVLVYPGEYVVHLLRPRIAPQASAVLRFVGADAQGRDVHVAVDPARDAGAELRRLLQRVSANDASSGD